MHRQAHTGAGECALCTVLHELRVGALASYAEMLFAAQLARFAPINAYNLHGCVCFAYSVRTLH